MAEIDPVILQLRADNGKYLAELRNTTRTVDQHLGQQGKRVKKLESEMRASSSRIALSLKGLAGTLATYFTGRELIGLLDSFTRLQNNMRVAGVEGGQLKVVQDRLFESAQRYGVELEGLSALFSSLSQASKDLGASQGQVFTVTDAVSASLKVTGTSAQAASGALLQLQQLFRGSKVQAQEYNSLIDTLYPLLEAVAAGSDRWGGSVGKLTNDVRKSSVTTQEFFQALLKGSDVLQNKAAKATLTLSSGITTLTNALTVYFGEADHANGVSAALGATLKKLADNLDTIIPALAAIAGFLGARYVGALVSARAATLAASAATVTLSGTLAALRTSLLAAFGGPVGAAILAVAAGIYFVNQRTRQLDQATGRYKAGLDSSNKVTERAEELSRKLADARGKERIATLEALRIEKARAQQALISAKNDLIAANAALYRARAQRAEQSQREGFGRGIGGMGMDPGGISTAIAGIPERKAQANVDAAEQSIKNLEANIDSLSEIIKGASAGATVPSGDEKPKKAKKPTGPSEADIQRQFESELDSYRSQIAGALAQQAKSADEAAEMDLRQVELARRATLRSLNADENYSEAQKKRLRIAVENLAEAEREAVEFQRLARIEQEQADLAEERFQSQRDALDLQYDLARTEADRRALALKILDAEDAYLRSKQEAILASETATEAEKERARLALAAINATAGARRAGVERQHQGALGRYLDDTADTAARAEEAATRELQALRDGLADGLTEQLGVKNQFIKDMLSIFLDDVLFRPIAEALRNTGGGGIGGFISGAIGSLFGRASGGYVGPGQMVRVNEHRPGVELLRMGPQGGTVIPLGATNAAATRAAPVAIQQTINVDARGVNPDGYAEHIRQIIRRDTTEIVAKASKATLDAAPQRVEQYRRYGR